MWRLGLMLGGVNATYFSTNAFLPDYLTQIGRADLIGPGLTALNLGQLPASFLLLACRPGGAARRAYVIFGALACRRARSSSARALSSRLPRWSGLPPPRC